MPDLLRYTLIAALLCAPYLAYAGFSGGGANILLFSEEQDNTGGWNNTWSGGVTITADNAVAPDGTVTADKIVTPNDTGDANQTKFIVLTPATVYTISLFVKNVDSVRSEIRIFDNTGIDTQATLIYNWTDGVPSTQSSSGASNITYTDVLNGWYRISYSFTSDGTNINHQIVIFPAVTGDVGTGIHVWGGQLVRGGNRPYKKTVLRPVARSSFNPIGF